MKKLLFVFALLLVLCLPIAAQDAEPVLTVEANPVTVIDGEGEGNTIVNVGGETPVGETPETPSEPMPWLASAILRVGEWGVQLLLAYIVVVRGVLAAVKAWLANPARVKATEDSVELLKAFIPDMIERGIAAGLKQAEATTLELYREIRRGIVEATDGLPAGSKARTANASPNSSVSTTGGSFDSTSPRVP